MHADVLQTWLVRK